MPKRIYLFYGEEDFLIQEKIDGLKKEIINPEFNVEQLDAAAVSVDQVISAMQTGSLLGGDKLVIVKHIDLKEGKWDELISELNHLPQGTSIVFQADSVAKKSGLYNYIEEHGESLEFKTFADWEQQQVVSWILRRVNHLGKKITEEAAVNLQIICGSGLRKLSSEIDKLITYAGKKEIIENEDVLAVASPGETSIFSMVNALGEKDIKTAYFIFKQIARNKIDPFHVLALLGTQYRVMLYTCFEKDPNKTARSLGTSPFFVKKCAERAKRFKGGELERNLQAVLDADLKLKTGEAFLPTFDLLLASLCGQ